MREADEPLLLHFQAKRRKELPGVAFPTFHGGSNRQPGIFADVRFSWEEGLRGVRFFLLAMRARMISRTARRPSLPKMISRQRVAQAARWAKLRRASSPSRPVLDGGSEIRPYHKTTPTAITFQRTRDSRLLTPGASDF